MAKAYTHDDLIKPGLDVGDFLTIGCLRSDGDMDVFATLNKDTFDGIAREDFNEVAAKLVALCDASNGDGCALRREDMVSVLVFNEGEEPEFEEEVTLKMPRKSWDLLSETLQTDAISSSFDAELRGEISAALETVREE